MVCNRQDQIPSRVAPSQHLPEDASTPADAAAERLVRGFPNLCQFSGVG